MSVTIHCPHCGATGNAPDHILGQSVRCSKCKKQFVAGGEEEEAPEEEPADSFDDMDEDSPAPPPKRKGKARSGGGGGGGSWFVNFATFRTLIAPKIIVILYWVFVAFIILGGLAAIGLSFTQGALSGIITFFVMLIVIPLECLFARIFFELALLPFRIHETLKELKKPG